MLEINPVGSAVLAGLTTNKKEKEEIRLKRKMRFC